MAYNITDACVKCGACADQCPVEKDLDKLIMHYLQHFVCSLYSQEI